ncbi:MAG: DMT family transporter [Bacteroidia bacterium]|nr:DMT family transporter [Bacteroidia bacterium]MBP6722628.1 DMT family transporter [Bacteroidia bacterium]
MNKGVAYMGLAVVFFAVMNVAIKYVAHLPTFELVFFRALIAASIAYTTLRVKGIPAWGNRKGLLILRGVFGFGALSMFIATLQNMPMATALVIQYMSPVFVAILGIFLLKEPMRPLQWVWLVMAFAGVVMIKGFDPRVSILYLSIGIASCILSAFAYTTVRSLKDTDHPLVVVFYFPLVTLPVAGLLMWYQWRHIGVSEFIFEQHTLEDWLWIVVMGVFAQLGQIFMTLSLHLEKANVVSSMSYLGMIFGLIFGYFLFGETYGIWAAAGIFLVLLGVLLNVFVRE